MEVVIPHLLILEEAISKITTVQQSFPSTALTNLSASFQAADTYVHANDITEESQLGQQIADVAGAAKGYLDVVSPPSATRLQGWADEMDNLIP